MGAYRCACSIHWQATAQQIRLVGGKPGNEPDFWEVRSADPFERKASMLDKLRDMMK